MTENAERSLEETLGRVARGEVDALWRDNPAWRTLGRERTVEVVTRWAAERGLRLKYRRDEMSATAQAWKFPCPVDVDSASGPEPGVVTGRVGNMLAVRVPGGRTIQVPEERVDRRKVLSPSLALDEREELERVLFAPVGAAPKAKAPAGVPPARSGNAPRRTSRKMPGFEDLPDRLRAFIADGKARGEARHLRGIAKAANVNWSTVKMLVTHDGPFTPGLIHPSYRSLSAFLDAQAGGIEVNAAGSAPAVVDGGKTDAGSAHSPMSGVVVPDAGPPDVFVGQTVRFEAVDPGRPGADRTIAAPPDHVARTASYIREKAAEHEREAARLRKMADDLVAWLRPAA